jgi:hypothetical protein
LQAGQRVCALRVAKAPDGRICHRRVLVGAPTGLPWSPPMKFSKTPHKKSGEGSTTSAVSTPLCGSAGLSSPNAVDRAADGGEDEGG